MHQPDSYSFKNSDTCHGFGVVGDSDISHDVIAIGGRYPESGSWARNLEAREQVILVSGIGSVALRGGGVIRLDASSETQRTAVIDPGEWFAYDGDMTISMVCQPGFDPEKYTVKTEDEIVQEIGVI